MAGKNLLVMHGGGPTAVINASLYGIVDEAKRSGAFAHVYGSHGGPAGMLSGTYIALDEIDDDVLAGLRDAPGSAIGTGRDALGGHYPQMVEVLVKNGIDVVMLTGGNGTMNTCALLQEACREAGADIQVIGVPKTMDNDIAEIDHAPGYGSAARYAAQSVGEVCCDVHSMPIHIVVVEVMGRSAGWVAAATALAEQCGQDGPDLIYVPERAFDEEAFLADCKRLIEEKGGGVVVASEGLHDAEGNPIVDPIMEVERETYFGDVSSHLANLIVARLGYKARSEKPGLLGRASMTLRSERDVDEAEEVGRAAVRAALDGATGVMVGIKRVPGEEYAVTTDLIDVERVRLIERLLPDEFINEAGNGVTQAFKDWAAPLVGDLPQFVSFL